MAQVYKFRVEAEELEKELWREFEISSNATVATFAYAVLAMFYAQGSHLFAVHHGEENYELPCTRSFKADFIPPLESLARSHSLDSKLSDLRLRLGSVLDVEYDFGTPWDFIAKLRSTAKMERGSGKRYPRVTDGAGSCMIEDVSPYDIAAMIKESKKTGILPRPYNIYADEDGDGEESPPWNYKEFYMDDLNSQLKGDIEYLRDLYDGIPED